MEAIKNNYLSRVLNNISEIKDLEIVESKLEESLPLSDIVLFKINELTYDEEDKMPRKEAFENVLGTIRQEGINFIYLLLGNSEGASFYFGIARDKNSKTTLDMPIKEFGTTLLESAITGNFRGSKVEKIKNEDYKKILEPLKRSERFGIIKGTPGINETSDNSNFQGVDRLVNVMSRDNYGLCIVAKPLSQDAINGLEEQIYSVYDRWSLFAKRNIQSGNNDSQTKGFTIGENKSVSTGTSDSTAKGESKTVGKSETKNVSITTGENKNFSTSEGTTKNKGVNKGGSSGTNNSKTVSSGTNSSSGSNTSYSSSSSGSNFGTSETGGTSAGKSWGYNTSKGDSKNTTKGSGTSYSENTGKSRGENSSTSESTTKTLGTNENYSKGKNSSTNTSSSTGTSLTVGTEIANKKVQDYMKYIDEQLLPMLDYGKSKGLFINNFFIFSDRKDTLIKLGNNVTSLYSGKKGNKNPLVWEILDDEKDDTLIKECKNFQIPQYINDFFRPEDIDALILKSHYIDQYIYDGWYSANELSIVGGLPQKEIVGLSLKQEVEFGLNITEEKPKEGIILGNLVQSGRELENIDVAINKKDLNKHTFITGVTGTGKTTTCQRLLLESELPFLVIEPAKTEYRILIDDEKTKDLLIFTLGNDTVAPFRLNPFEFIPGESITSRVDMVKGAIKASFDMEAAIPQLIESTIYECYEDYGWNVATNENELFEDPYAEGVYSFPTLSDVMKKVESVVDKQGFDTRLRNDYIGSIRGRLGGLLQGSKGLMLDVHRGIDFRKLIEKKVVLEIEGIKDGEEKSLIMGFILTNVYEALRAKHKEDRDFRHITLVEEAHRLLSRVSPGDSPNKKNGVEMFADLLAEVRKYGESLVIVDQIANKLTPEVLKNTNTKIVHKIFAEDDKEAIGNTMFLSKEQKEFLSSLKTGRAIVFSQGWEKPRQVQIKLMHDTTGDRNVEDEELVERNLEFYIENYKSGIFYGSQLLKEKPSKDQMRYIMNFTRNFDVNIMENAFNKIDIENDEEKYETILNYKEIKKGIRDLKKKIESLKFEKSAPNSREFFINSKDVYVKEFAQIKDKIESEVLVEVIVEAIYGDGVKDTSTIVYTLKKMYKAIVGEQEGILESLTSGDEQSLRKFRK